MEKDADAYRTISEVSETLDIPAHVLRFWETKFPQVKPLKRGGGRRYYRRADTELLRSIRRLLYDEGYTIRGVQRLLKVKGPASVARLAEAEAAIPAEEDVGEEMPDAGQGDEARTSGAAPGSIDPRNLAAVFDFVAAEIKACRVILDEASRQA